MAHELPILTPDRTQDVLTTNGLVLLDFWQATCPPCRALEPRLAAFVDRHLGAFTAWRIDVDTDLDAAARFGVQSIPTLLMLRAGVEVARRDGLIREPDLERLLADTTAPP